MAKKAMNVDEIAEMARWYSTVYHSTEFMAFGPGGAARVQVTCAGLHEVASVESWGWKERYDASEMPWAGDPWEAFVQHSTGVMFYALFSESEKEKALASVDSMLPDYAALAAHEPVTATEDSRESAGLGVGPFQPTITTVDLSGDDEASKTLRRNRALLHGPELVDI